MATKVIVDHDKNYGAKHKRSLTVGDATRLPSRSVSPSTRENVLPSLAGRTRNRSVSIERSNAIRRSSRSRSPTPSINVISASDTNKSLEDVMDDITTTIYEDVIPGPSDSRDLNVRLSISLDRKPNLSLDTKVSGQKSLRPLTLVQKYEDDDLYTLPPSAHLSHFVGELNDQSPWKTEPVDDGSFQKESTVNQLLNGPGKTFDEMIFKEGRPKGWTQKQILQGLKQTGLTAKTPIEPISPARVVKRGDIRQDTTCLYEALRYVLPNEYWIKLDPKITTLGDLPWSMYRYAAWICHLKKYAERCFLIELNKFVGFTNDGKPIHQDHIEYYGPLSFVKKVKPIPLGISFTNDMKTRMVSDGVSLKMIIFGSELFPLNPRECTMREGITFLTELNPANMNLGFTPRLKTDPVILQEVIKSAGGLERVAKSMERIAAFATCIPWCYIELDCCLLPDQPFYRTLVVGTYGDYWIVAWYTEKEDDGNNNLSFIRKVHTPVPPTHSIPIDVTLGKPECLSWPDHFHCHDGVPISGWGSCLIPAGAIVQPFEVSRNWRHLHYYRPQAENTNNPTSHSWVMPEFQDPVETSYPDEADESEKYYTDLHMVNHNMPLDVQRRIEQPFYRKVHLSNRHRQSWITAQHGVKLLQGHAARPIFADDLIQFILENSRMDRVNTISANGSAHINFTRAEYKPRVNGIEFAMIRLIPYFVKETRGFRYQCVDQEGCEDLELPDGISFCSFPNEHGSPMAGRCIGRGGSLSDWESQFWYSLLEQGHVYGIDERLLSTLPIPVSPQTTSSLLWHLDETDKFFWLWDGRPYKPCAENVKYMPVKRYGTYSPHKVIKQSQVLPRVVSTFEIIILVTSAVLTILTFIFPSLSDHLTKPVWFLVSWAPRWLYSRITASGITLVCNVGLFLYAFHLLVIYLKIEPYKKIPSLEDFDTTLADEPVYVDVDYPDIDRGVLVTAMGTRGDIRPMNYLARVLTKFGVNTAFRIIKEDSAQDLRDVANGVHWQHVPYYLKTQTLGRAGWKHIYSTFNNAPNTTCVQLMPSRRYIGAFKIKDTFLGVITKFGASLISPNFYLGNLQDSTIGRSADGFNLLRDRRHENKAKSGTVGFVLGSDQLLRDDPKVMETIGKYGAEEITETDHATAFTKYHTVLCHGGAGTMGTIIASGAVAIALNNQLDRDYHAPLRPREYKQTTPLPIIVHAYYKTGKPIPWNWIWAVRKELWIAFFNMIMFQVVFIILKVIYFPQTFQYVLGNFLLLVITVGPSCRRLLPTAVKILRPVLGFYFHFPIASRHPSLIIPCLFCWAFTFMLPSMLEDVTTLMFQPHRRYYLQFHYVKISRDWSLPGHLSIYDTYTGRRWEGAFRSEVKYGGSFYSKLQASPRYVKEYAFEYPIQLDPQKFPELLEEGKYSVTFNCQTMVLKLMGIDHFFLLIPVIVAVCTGAFMLTLWLFMSFLAQRMLEIPQPGDIVPDIAFVYYEQSIRMMRGYFKAYAPRASTFFDELFGVGRSMFSDLSGHALSKTNEFFGGLTRTPRYDASWAAENQVFIQWVDEHYRPYYYKVSAGHRIQAGEAWQKCRNALSDATESVRGYDYTPMFRKTTDIWNGIKLDRLPTFGTSDVAVCNHGVNINTCEVCAPYQVESIPAPDTSVQDLSADCEYNDTCSHDILKRECPECSIKSQEDVIAEKSATALQRQAFELEMLAKEDLRRGEIDAWVKSKLKSTKHNAKLEDLEYAIGLLGTLTMKSPRCFVILTPEGYKAYKAIKTTPDDEDLTPESNIPSTLPIHGEMAEDDYVLALQGALFEYLMNNVRADLDDFPAAQVERPPIPVNAKESDNRHMIAIIVDAIYDLIRPVFKIIPQLVDAYDWLKNQILRNTTYINNVLAGLSRVAGLLYDYSLAMWEDLCVLVSAIIDIIFVDKYVTRIKSVWAATSLVKQPALALRLRLESQIAYMSPTKRGDPIGDISEWTKGLEDSYIQIHGKKPKYLAFVSRTFEPFHNLIRDLQAKGERCPDFHFVNESSAIDQSLLDKLTRSNGIVVCTNPHILSQDFIHHGFVTSAPEDAAYKYFKFDRRTICDDEGEMLKAICHHASDYNTGGLFYHGLSRSISVDAPMMTTKEAKLHGYKPGEYWVDPLFEARSEDMAARGIPQGGDGVFFAEKHPEKNRISYSRYDPRYRDVSPEEAALNDVVTTGFVNQYPEALDKTKLTPPQMIRKYLDSKDAYSSGAPFLQDFRKRGALFDAGFDQVFIKNAMQKLESGTYGHQMYHGFLKSQVVDLEKLVKGKDPRSVVAQDLASYYIDQVIQLERNKRVTWRTTGVGIGMILNQNMQWLFENLEDFKNRGGYYFEADATQFDSRTTPGMFDALAKLTAKGFQWKGADLAARCESVMRANYKTMQDTYIFGITEQKWNGLTIGVHDQATIDRLVRVYPDKFVRYYHSDVKGQPSMTPPTWWKPPFDDAEDEKAFYSFDPAQQENIRKCKWGGTKGLEGKIILTTHKHATPNPRTHPYFAYLTPDVPDEYETPHLKVEGEGDNSLQNTLLRLSDNLDKIYNLHFKSRGGGTGQSATSWDNTWGFRLQFCKGWMKYWDYTKSVEDFFKQVVIFNTGDDTMVCIRLRKKDYDIDRLAACMKDFGLHLTLDIIDDIENIQYLGNRVLRLKTHSYERSFYNDWARVRSRQSGKPLEPAPRFLVYHDQSQTEMRGSAKRYYQASVKARRYLHADVQSLVGKATLTAWNPHLYRTLGTYYIEDVQALARYYRVSNVDIRLVKAHGEFNKTKNPWWFVDIRGRPSKKQMQSWHDIITNKVKGRLSQQDLNRYQFWSFVLSNPYPTFFKVTSIQMKLRNEDPDKYDKFFEKFFSDPKYSDQRIREWVDYLSGTINKMPREWYKLQPHLGVIFPDPTFYTPEQYIEKFIYLKGGGENLTKDEFLTLLAQSPYGALTDGELFYHNLSRPEFVEEMNKHPEYVYLNMVVWITITYLTLYPIEIWLVTVPWIGIYWRIFILLAIDVPKIYSVLNLLFWHLHGYSSPTISALVPRDPYVQMKRFAGTVVSIMPIELGYVRWDLLLPFIVKPLPYFADAVRRIQSSKSQPQDAHPSERPKNPWDKFTTGAPESDFVSQFHTPSKAMVVTAATGTGKSTMLPPAVDVGDHRLTLSLPGGNRIRSQVILFPRNILVQEWSSPLVNVRTLHNRLQSYIVRRGVKLDNLLNVHGTIFLMTYGHFINRKELHDPEFRKSTVFYLDEFHENTDEMKRCYEILHPRENLGKLILLSATPSPVPWAEATHFAAPIAQRFKKRIIVKDFKPGKLITEYLWAREQFPDHAKPENVIIRCVTNKEVVEVMNGLAELNVPCQPLSRATSHIPIDKSKCLVTTQIIDAGINLPGRRLLIETGYEMKSVKGQVIYEPSSKTTSKQLEGRVGRYQDGDIVIRPSWSGTGRSSHPYSTPELYTSDLVSSANGVMKLVDASHPRLITNTGRYSYMAINPTLPDFHEGMVNNLFLLIEIEQSIQNKGHLEVEYRRIMKDYDKIQKGVHVTCKPELDHIYASLEHRTLTNVDFNSINRYRNSTNAILYCLEFNPEYPYPEACAFNPATLQEENWDSYNLGDRAWFSVRSLALKEQRWIEAESFNIIRELVSRGDQEKAIIDFQKKMVNDQYDRVISQLQAIPDEQAVHNLQREKEILLHKINKQFHNIKAPLLYHGAIWDPDDPDETPKPALASICAITCPICGATHDHMHDSRLQSMEKWRAKLLPYHPPDQSIQYYYMNPLVTQRNRQNLLKQTRRLESTSTLESEPEENRDPVQEEEQEELSTEENMLELPHPDTFEMESVSEEENIRVPSPAPSMETLMDLVSPIAQDFMPREPSPPPESAAETVVGEGDLFELTLEDWLIEHSATLLGLDPVDDEYQIRQRIYNEHVASVTRQNYRRPLMSQIMPFSYEDLFIRLRSRPYGPPS